MFFGLGEGIVINDNDETLLTGVITDLQIPLKVCILANDPNRFQDCLELIKNVPKNAYIRQ